ncbi:helix-turn-helix domain-containing protein [Glycomyces paridis]|uniref:helix-turn-helix domain-containing protein n=1 Tax=Glycomyces paridis TaxID=2126555 RepID=UPI00195E260E|nr:helix-turn-helix transcriptional regulator [Glycomyces paridis]
MAETFPPQHPAATARGGSREPLWRDALGERLRATRHEKGETLSETADRAGISPQYLSEIERGRKEPSSEMIAAVAGALDTTLGDLAAAIAERLAGALGARTRAAAERDRPLAPADEAAPHGDRSPEPSEREAPQEQPVLETALFDRGLAPAADRNGESTRIDAAEVIEAAALDAALADAGLLERAETPTGPTCRAAYALAA